MSSSPKNLFSISENDLMNPAAPPNTRASSPVSVLSGQDLRLPYTEPIPEEHREIATPWIQVIKYLQRATTDPHINVCSSC